MRCRGSPWPSLCAVSATTGTSVRSDRRHRLFLTGHTLTLVEGVLPSRSHRRGEVEYDLRFDGSGTEALSPGGSPAVRGEGVMSLARVAGAAACFIVFGGVAWVMGASQGATGARDVELGIG